MSADTDFPELMARLRAGDQEVAAQIFQNFSRRLIALARSRLAASIGPKEDAEDVIQRPIVNRQA